MQNTLDSRRAQLARVQARYQVEHDRFVRLRRELGVDDSRLVAAGYADLLLEAPELLLRAAADAIGDALEHDNDRDAVLSALSRAFFRYIEDPAPTGLDRVVAALRRPVPITTATLGLSGPTAIVPPTRAYGAPAKRG